MDGAFFPDVKIVQIHGAAVQPYSAGISRVSEVQGAYDFPTTAWIL
jgi:hypothetical protein